MLDSCVAAGDEKQRIVAGMLTLTELLKQDYTEKRVMYPQTTVVINEAKLSESVHEKIYSGACSTDHFRQGRLTYIRGHFLPSAFFPEVG